MRDVASPSLFYSSVNLSPALRALIVLLRKDRAKERSGQGYWREVTDDLLEHYGNRRRGTLHAAIRDLRAKCADIVDSVSAPFPPGEVMGGANIGVTTIDEIIRLHEGRMRVSGIAEAANLSRGTVRRWIKRDGQ